MNSRRYIVFGAPGAGKSTLLSCLPRHDRCVAIDLENIGGKEDYSLPEAKQTERNKRKDFLFSLQHIDFRTPLFVGCADVDPRDFPKDFKVVLLHHPNHDGYMAWVKKRDTLWPEKAGQAYTEMYEHMARFEHSGRYDFKLNPSDHADQPDELAKHLWKLINLPRV